MITAGEVLKKKRENLGKNLDTVSLDTKIQKRFLQYIEKNEFNKFDSEVFLTGFIKIYSKYLDLDVEKVLALYRRSKPAQTKEEKKQTSVQKNIKKNLLTPKLIITISIALFFIGLLLYIGIQIYKFQSPPALEITEPIQDSIVQVNNITIKGKTDINATIQINDVNIEIEKTGYFQKELPLNEGINLITIKARKNNNNILETVETLKITYTKQTEETTTPTTTNILSIEIKDSPAWVRLDIDDENKISEVVQPNKKEYTVNNKFYVITGRANNTIVSFNNNPIAWKANTTTGVAEIKCEIVNSTLNCQ